MTAKVKIRHYVIVIEQRKFDTADIKCFTVILFFVLSMRLIEILLSSTELGIQLTNI